MALVSGSVVGNGSEEAKFDGISTLRGAPRSADGRWLVVPTALGILAVTNDKAVLWRTQKVEAELGKPQKLGDCVIANEARAIACIHADRAFLIRRP